MLIGRMRRWTDGNQSSNRRMSHGGSTRRYSQASRDSRRELTPEVIRREAEGADEGGREGLTPTPALPDRGGSGRSRAQRKE